MTFTYEGADLSRVIDCIYCEGNSFNIYYLDGSKSTYFCSDKEEKEKIKRLMIKQAEERSQKLNINYLNDKIKFNLLHSLNFVAFATLWTVAEKKVTIPALALITLASVQIKNYFSNKTRIEELKKYKMFLELLDTLDEINEDYGKPKFLPLDIDTLDSFSYKEIKSLYKYYKQ